MKNNIALLALFFVTFSLFNGCKKNDDECPICPSVVSIFPSSGNGRDTLTITGINFAESAADNIVKINGVLIEPEKIISGTSTEIKVIVPLNCGTGPVTVDFDSDLTNQGTPPVFQYINSYFVDVKTQLFQPYGIAYNSLNNKMYAIHKSQGAGGYNIVEISMTGYAVVIDSCPANQIMRDITLRGNDIYVRLSTTVAPLSDKILKISGSSKTALAPTFVNFTVNGIAIDGSGNVYVASFENKIYKIALDGSLSTFAGTGAAGTSDGPAASATFNSPYALAFDNQNNLYVTQTNANANFIRKITPAGIVSTLAGTAGPGGSTDGPGSSAQFNDPRGIVCDNNGNVYVAEYAGQRIRKIDSNGNVTTLAGSGFTTANGVTIVDNISAQEATFNHPYDMAIDGTGNIWITDLSNNLIRVINTE